MSKMNPEIKTRWVTALRSGEYAQAKNALRNDKGFCCLGVLCDVYAKANNKQWEHSPTSNKKKLYGTGGFEVLPDTVSTWAGLDTLPWAQVNNPVVKVPAERLSLQTAGVDKLVSLPLAQLNDIEGFAFSEIADLIEEQL